MATSQVSLSGYTKSDCWYLNRILYFAIENLLKVSIKMTPLKNLDSLSENQAEAYIQTTFGRRFSAMEMKHIIAEVTSHKHLFNALVDHIMDENQAFNIGAPWVLSYAGVRKPDWFLNRLNDLIHHLKPNTHQSVYRAISRVLKYISIPEDQVATVINICMHWIEDPKQSIAVKAFSLHTMAKFVSQVPEICHELRFLIESMMPYASSGLKNAGQKVLQKIEKLGY